MDSRTFRSSIKPELLRSKLYYGTSLAFIGMLLWLYAGIFMPVEALKIWGLPLAIIGITLITIGLLPYRKLKRLVDQPNQVIITTSSLTYLERQKVRKEILISDIKAISFFDEGSHYGIILKLDKEDLLLPFFNARVERELNEWLLDS